MTTPIEDLRAAHEARLRAIIAKMATKGNYENIVERIIEDSAYEIIANAIGLTRRDDNDTWEIDHCNGRKSAIAKEIGEYTMQLIRAAIPEFLQEFKKPNKAIQAAIKREFDEIFDRQLRYELRDMAEKMAEAEAHRLIDIFRKSNRAEED